MAKPQLILERIVANLDKAREVFGRPADTVFIGPELYGRLVAEYNTHFVTGRVTQYPRLIAGAEVIVCGIVTDLEGQIAPDVYEVFAFPDFVALSKSRPFHNAKLGEGCHDR